MDRGNADAASHSRSTAVGRLSPDARKVLDAFLATATGTAAGILVDSGFSLRPSIVDGVFRFLGPLFDVLSDHPNAQLVLAGFIHRIPIVLIVGMLVGLLLRRFSYPRLLLCSVPIWFAYLVGRKLIFALLVLSGAGEGRVSAGFSGSQIIPEFVLYSMQYALLIFVIRTTDAVLAQSARRKSAVA